MHEVMRFYYTNDLHSYFENWPQVATYLKTKRTNSEENNEGITLPHQQVYHLYDDANFEVICSNLQCTVSENPPWLLHSKRIQSKQGVEIGLVALTARFNPYYHLLGWNIEETYEVLDSE